MCVSEGSCVCTCACVPQVVLAPIAVGMLANKYANRAVQAVLPLTPVVGVLSTCFLVASAVAQVAPTIISAGLGLQACVALLCLGS